MFTFTIVSNRGIQAQVEQVEHIIFELSVALASAERIGEA